MYGRNVKSTAIQIETAPLKRVIARAGKTALLSLKIDKARKPDLVLIKGIQRDPVTGELLHVDFYQVKMTEKLRLEVPLVLVGKAPVAKDKEGVLIQELNSVEVECLPANIPHNIEVDVSNLAEIDQVIHVKDIFVSEGVTILTELENVVAKIVRTRAELAEEVAVAEAKPTEEAEEAEKAPTEEKNTA